MNRALDNLSSRWDRATKAFVPEALVSQGPEATRRAQFAVTLMVIVAVAAGIRSIVFYLNGLPHYAAAVGASTAVMIALPWALRLTGSLALTGNILCGVVFVGLSAVSYARGGLGSAPLAALGLVPLLGGMIIGWRAAAVWGALAIGVVVALSRVGPLPDFLAETGASQGVGVIGHIVLILFVVSITGVYELTKNTALQSQARSEAKRRQLQTERERLTEDLLRAERAKQKAWEQAKLLRADRMASVGQIAAGVAHEANNPLAYVTANLSFVQRSLERLRGNPGDEDVIAELRQAVVEAREGADRVSQIVRDLKAFARSDEEEVSWVDPREVLESTIKMADTEIRHRAKLIRSYEPAGPVRANEARLAQVYLNLLVNAAQAIPEGNVQDERITVRICTGPGGTTLTEVSDTGEGIAPEHLHMVTEPFFTTKPIGVGTGLGLSVCKSIIESYGGRLELDSNPGEGTTVRVFLPALAETGVTSGTRRRAEHQSSAELFRVLIIDDDPLVVRALRRILRKHDITSASGGREGLEALERDSSYDVILCDLMMPDLTGMEVYDRVKARGDGLEERLVFLTGGAFTERAREFLDTVSNRYLEKPLPPEQLDELLAELARESSRRIAT